MISLLTQFNKEVRNPSNNNLFAVFVAALSSSISNYKERIELTHEIRNV